MADILSQGDLDALWASDIDQKAADEAWDGTPEASASGISQADLDALFRALGGGSVAGIEEKSESCTDGLSQNDLDALWGGLTLETGRVEPTIVAEPAVSAKSENLSQDDIDALLAEMGR